MTDPNLRETRVGQTLTARVWSLIEDAGREVGVPVVVAQGGYKGGHGANASAGTHDEGDVFDLSVRTVPPDKRVPLVVALRARNVAAWLRDRDHGWTSTGPHIHGVVIDSHDPLSHGARQQVSAYLKSRDGLKANRPDPFPRPEQRPYQLGEEPPDVPLTSSEVTMLAQAPTGSFWLVHGDHMVNVSAEDAATWTGPRIVIEHPATWVRMVKAWTQVS